MRFTFVFIRLIRIRESLAGRATRTRLVPFSLSEVSRDLTDLADIPRSAALEERAMRHFATGGYPEVWLSDDPDRLLSNLVESIILRDATYLHRIGRPDAFRRLLRLSSLQVDLPAMA